MTNDARRVGDDRDTAERIRDLEARLEEMERGPRIRERAKSRFDSVVPPEAVHHFRTASREHLLGVRTVVDHWIKRIDDSEEVAAPSERETIEVR
jgi:hypothetical protein